LPCACHALEPDLIADSAALVIVAVPRPDGLVSSTILRLSTVVPVNEPVPLIYLIWQKKNSPQRYAVKGPVFFRVAIQPLPSAGDGAPWKKQRAWRTPGDRLLLLLLSLLRRPVDQALLLPVPSLLLLLRCPSDHSRSSSSSSRCSLSSSDRATSGSTSRCSPCSGDQAPNPPLLLLLP
jgi:hypothetical protein